MLEGCGMTLRDTWIRQERATCRSRAHGKHSGGPLLWQERDIFHGNRRRKDDSFFVSSHEIIGAHEKV